MVRTNAIRVQHIDRMSSPKQDPSVTALSEVSGLATHMALMSQQYVLLSVSLGRIYVEPLFQN